jgi:hypothetical protein
VSLIVVIAAFEEEALLPGALASLETAGVDRVELYDGSWGTFSDHPLSQDRTVEIARAWGCHIYQPDTPPWHSQEVKRTTMFHLGPRADGDHVFVMDCDERVEGCFPRPLPDGHANVMVACVGPNDMPGIRGEWPRGDFSNEYKPEIRLFRWSPALQCLWPGGYADERGRIHPYRNAQGDSALPVLRGVSFTHHGAERSPERIEQKIAYYHDEHPKRLERQRAYTRFGGR